MLKPKPLSSKSALKGTPRPAVRAAARLQKKFQKGNGHYAGAAGDKKNFEKNLAVINLPAELLAYLGGGRYQSPAMRRTQTIAQLQQWHSNGAHPTPASQLQGGAGQDPDLILSDVALNGVLRKKNITPTGQRVLMMKILFQRKNHHHITAEAIFAQIKNKKKSAKKSAISLASVYNNLNLFVDHGLLARYYFLLPSGKTPKPPAIFYDTNVLPHHHIVDKASGKIYDLPLSLAPLDPLVDRVVDNIKTHTIIPANLWRAGGARRTIFITPMVFILE